MGNDGLLVSLRRRRMQRWLHREALLLAAEAHEFDCPAVRAEAGHLLSMTGGGTSSVLRFA